MSRDVVVVSGLPRSGTSVMMRMLACGGLEVLTDRARAADDDNPRGYFELEAVKRTGRDPSWLDAAGGKAVKVVSKLLADLPSERACKVVFMRRPLDEVLASQRRMLSRLQRPDGHGDAEMKRLFVDHLAEVETWLRTRTTWRVLYVSYNRMIAEPRTGAERVARFLDTGLDVDAMVGAVEPALHRNRS